MLMSTPPPVSRGSQIGKMMRHGHKPQQISSGCILKRCLFPTFKMLEVQLVWVKQHSRQFCSHCCCRKPRGRCQQGEGTWIQLEKAAPVPVHHPKLWVWGSAAGNCLPVVSSALGVLGLLHPWRDGHRSQRAFPTEL